MYTLSIKLDKRLIDHMDGFIEDGVAENRLEFIQKAVNQYIQDQAVESILRAQKEPDLEGNLDELAKQFK